VCIVQVILLAFTHTGASVVSAGVFGPGSGPVFLDEVVCTGTEQGLMECAHAGIGNHICGRAVLGGLIQSEHDFDVSILCKGTGIFICSFARLMQK